MLAGYVAAQFRGDRQIVLEQRGVPREIVTRALTLFFLYAMLIAVSTFLLSITENGILHRTGREGVSMLRLLFETVSALGTVGLLMAVQSLQPRKAYAVAESQLPIG